VQSQVITSGVVEHSDVPRCHVLLSGKYLIDVSKYHSDFTFRFCYTLKMRTFLSNQTVGNRISRFESLNLPFVLHSFLSTNNSFSMLFVSLFCCILNVCIPYMLNQTSWSSGCQQFCFISGRSRGQLLTWRSATLKLLLSFQYTGSKWRYTTLDLAISISLQILPTKSFTIIFEGSCLIE
jgi:hypothetical protein